MASLLKPANSSKSREKGLDMRNGLQAALIALCDKIWGSNRKGEIKDDSQISDLGNWIEGKAKNSHEIHCCRYGGSDDEFDIESVGFKVCVEGLWASGVV
jgi:hypothetical protein